MYQGVSAKAAEHRKRTENDPKCVELGWRCILLAVESYVVSKTHLLVSVCTLCYVLQVIKHQTTKINVQKIFLMMFHNI